VLDDDPLLSWRDGAAKSRVLDAVTALAAELPPARRIAAVDEDGTLCCERPLAAWAYLLVAHWRDQVTAEPGLAARQPYKAAAVGDMEYFADPANLATQVSGTEATAFAGLRLDGYVQQVEHFLATARHPRLPASFAQLAYQPMRELLDLLRDNGFTVFVWAADRDFTRVLSPAAYGVPAHQVVGAAAGIEYRDGTLRRVARPGTPAGQPSTAGQPAGALPRPAAKVVDVVDACGYPPAFAAGNADDDLELLRLARFPLVLRHDDAEREYAYADESGELLATAAAAAWTTASLRDDFSQLFPE
jgi:hypothetical protein